MNAKNFEACSEMPIHNKKTGTHVSLILTRL